MPHSSAIPIFIFITCPSVHLLPRQKGYLIGCSFSVPSTICLRLSVTDSMFMFLLRSRTRTSVSTLATAMSVLAFSCTANVPHCDPVFPVNGFHHDTTSAATMVSCRLSCLVQLFHVSVFLMPLIFRSKICQVACFLIVLSEKHVSRHRRFSSLCTRRTTSTTEFGVFWVSSSFSLCFFSIAQRPLINWSATLLAPHISSVGDLHNVKR